MRADAAVADRNEDVRAAARGWRKADAIDAATRQAIEAAYPDDCVRLGPVFRALVALFALVAANGFFGVLAIVVGINEHSVGFLCLVFGAAMALTTEILTGPLKRADSGVETATALLAFGYGTFGTAWLFCDAMDLIDGRAFNIACAVVMLAAAAGVVRWGFSFFAVGGVGAFFLLLGRMPYSRALWIAAALGLAVPTFLASRSPAWTPSHRRSARAALLLMLAALYVAVHVGSWDHRVLEELAGARSGETAGPGLLRVASILATAAVPLAILAAGVATREGLLVNLGIALGVASLVTLRFYVHVAPLWVVLIASGTAAFLVAVALRRFLAAGANGERAGFTAEPLFQDLTRQQALEMIGAAALAPAISAAPSADPALRPGGGEYGGGGASGTY